MCVSRREHSHSPRPQGRGEEQRVEAAQRRRRRVRRGEQRGCQHWPAGASRATRPPKSHASPNDSVEIGSVDTMNVMTTMAAAPAAGPSYGLAEPAPMRKSPVS